MDAAEYHNARATSYAQNFHSLRQVEWQVAFQAYAGYSVIVVGYHALVTTCPKTQHATFGWIAILLTIFVFIVTCYLALRILERMHSTRELENWHLDRMRQHVATKNYPFKPDPGTPPASQCTSMISKIIRNWFKSNGPFRCWFAPHAEPIHNCWYAFTAQMLINLAWVMGIVSYVVYRTELKNLFSWVLSWLPICAY